MNLEGIFLYLIFCHLSLGFESASSQSNDASFYLYPIKSTCNLNVIEKEKISIECPIACHNCTQSIVQWYHNGYLVQSDFDGITTNGSFLSITTYDGQKHSGVFMCVFSSVNFSLGSPNITVVTSDFPSFSIKSQFVYLNGIAVFTCHDVSKYYNRHLQVTWYKDDRVLRDTENDDRIARFDEVLMIKHVVQSDVGSYHCELAKSGLSVKKRSEKKFLKIQEALNHSPDIPYSSQDKQVLINEEFSIFCSTKVRSGVVITIYKKSAHGPQEFKLKQAEDYVIIKERAQENTFYVCEAENGNVRAKEDIAITVFGIPKISEISVYHTHQYIDQNISFDCKATGYPKPLVKWYHNNNRIREGVSPNGTWLTVKRLSFSDGGFYQCIAQNAVGSSSKSTFLSLGMSEMTPMNFTTEALSPTKFLATWRKPAGMVEQIGTYRLICTGPDGSSIVFETNSMSMVVKNLIGGFRYTVKLCILPDTKDDGNECAYSDIQLPETLPTRGPVFNKPEQNRKQVFDVSWQPLADQHAHGVIQKYTIYCEVLDGVEKGQLETFVQSEPWKTYYKITLGVKATYKIWVTASNSIGESEKSNAHVLLSYLVEPYRNIANFQVKWRMDSSINDNDIVDRVDVIGDALLSWDLQTATSSDKYKLYYVRVPYKRYWDEVHVLTLSNKSRTSVVRGLDLKSRYRFTLIPVKEAKTDSVLKPCGITKRNDVKFLVRSSNVFLMPRRTSRDTSGTDLQSSNHGVVPHPQDFECVKIDRENELMLSWKALDAKYNTSEYEVRVFSELGTSDVIFLTHDTHLHVINLTQGFWYGVQLKGVGDGLTKQTFNATPFKSCRTKEEVPSMVRDVRYNFIYDKEKQHPYLHLSWKAPLYVGASTYSYMVVRCAENKRDLKNPPFPFPWDSKRLFLAQRGGKSRMEKGRVHLNGLWTERINESNKQKVRQNFEIFAISDAGIGVIYRNVTHYIELQPTFVATTTSPPPDEALDTGVGIIVGASITVFFMFAFIIICTVKEPCRRTAANDALLATTTDNANSDYLYVEKLKQLQAESIDSSQCSNGITIADRKKMSRWKFRKFLPFSKQYQPANSTELSNTVLYSSSSSSSTSRVHTCDRSRCHSQQGSSSGLHSSCDRTSDGQITFLSEPAAVSSG